MAGNRNSGEMAAGPLYFCYGAEHTFTIKAVDDNPWINQAFSTLKGPDEPDFPVMFTPDIGAVSKLTEQGVSWTIKCPTKPADAPIQTFPLFWLKSEFTSPYYTFDMPVSLGHHRIDFVEASGHEQFQVIEYGEETTLKAREISYYTKEAMPFAAQWKLGEQDLQSTVPDPSGWVTYNFKTANPGIHPVNVTVPSLYYEQGYFRKELPVHALAVTPWGNDAVLQVNRKDESDVVDRGVVCPRGSLMMVSLLNENLLLKDSMVSLKSADATALGIIFTPDLETEWSMEGGSHYWNLAITGAKSGLFKLQMHCSKLKRDWDIIGHVLSKELKDEVEKIEVNGAPISDFGAVFFRGESRPLTIAFAESMRGLYVSLDETGSPGMTYNPPLKAPRKIPDDLKLEWQVTGGDRSSVFELQVICADVETPLTIDSRVMSKITIDEIESLKVNGEPVDLTQPEFLFFRSGAYTIELIPKPESSLIGLDVALKKGSGGELGMIYDPPLEEPHPLTEAGLKWTVTGGATQSGLFELLIDVPQVEQSMPVTCRLLSTNLADEVKVWIGGKDATSGGGVLFRGQPGTVKLEPKPGSPIAGYPIALKRTATSPLLPTDLSSSPRFDDPGTSHEWSVTGANNKSGYFQLQIVAQGMTTFNVTANRLLSSDLKDEVEKVEVNGVGISDIGAVFWRKETRPLAVTFAESMRGLYVSLDETGSPGMTYNPPLKEPRKVQDDLKLEWQVTGGDRSSVFELQVVCADVETPLTIESRVMSKITTDEIESLKVNGEPVDLTQPEFLFFRAGNYTIELIPKPESALIGLNVALAGGGGVELGMIYEPPLEKLHPLTEAGLKWTVTGGATQSGLFDLLIDVPQVEQSMAVTCRLLSTNLADEVTVLLNGVEMPLAGADIPSGGTATLTLAYKSPYLLPGINLALDALLESGLVPGDLTSQPPLLEQTVNHEWVITAAENKIGTFKLKLLTVEEQAVLLTPSNRLFAPINTRFESFGGSPLLRPPEKNPSDTNTFFSYRVALTSLEGQPLVGVPVTFYAPGSRDEMIEGTTDNRGLAFNLSLFQRAGVYTIRAVAKVAGVDRELEVLVDVVAA
ncbi:Ig-like domain-containing protein [Pseudomonas laurylsulfatiphila]|uniref:Ig-like domain-containing protein n=1 Tax=Pseudomonas laurylsulfatiphila TaxID=2011015 RepID=UPI00215F41AB|nr:Ig-like domain-containing protein [Pseudomonas laurylsulfatiphila]UVM02763.1 Ig-like domain-containing protein [Pseudomonas laurylsulfatiphila]